MCEKILIRNMLLSDYASVYELWINTPGMGLNDIDDSYEGIEKYLYRNPSTCFVAEKGGALVGAILCGHDGRRGYISHSAVRADERHQGIGGALVSRAMDALKAEGINKVALVVFAKNEVGNRFWESHGFTARTDLVYRNKTSSSLIV